MVSSPASSPAVLGAITWPVVVNRLQGLVGTLDINAGKETVIPATVLSALKGRNATLAIHSMGGMALTLTGTDLRLANIAADTKLDLSAVNNAKTIPEKLIAEKKALLTRQISIKDTAAFPFNVNMHVALGKENAGKYANLYRLSDNRSQLDYCGSFKIIDIGNAAFAMNRGGEYLVTVTNAVPQEKIAGGAYQIVKGDSLYKIARRNKMSLSELLRLNPELSLFSRLKIGQTIRIS